MAVQDRPDRPDRPNLVDEPLDCMELFATTADGVRTMHLVSGRLGRRFTDYAACS